MNIRYCWGFPLILIYLIIKCRSRRVIIRTVGEVEVFLHQLQSNQVELTVAQKSLLGSTCKEPLLHYFESLISIPVGENHPPSTHLDK